MLKLPATCSTRAASPNRFATAVTWASLAPVTVSSTDTTTWSVLGSTAQAVPTTRADLSSVAVTAASRAAPYLTSSGVAPAARTWAAAALSVTVTTTVPDASRYEPAVRAPSWLTSAPATRPAAARVIAARRTQVRVVVTAEPPVWAGSAPGIARPEGDGAWAALPAEEGLSYPTGAQDLQGTNAEPLEVSAQEGRLHKMPCAEWLNPNWASDTAGWHIRGRMCHVATAAGCTRIP